MGRRTRRTTQSLMTPTGLPTHTLGLDSRGSRAEVSSEPQVGLPRLGVLHQEETHLNTIKAIYDKPRLPGGALVKTLPAGAGDAGLIRLQGRSPGGEDGNPLQYSCLGNPMDRGAWGTTVHGVTKGWTRLSD